MMRKLLAFVAVAAITNLFVALFVETLGLLIGVVAATVVDVVAFVVLSWRS